MADTPYRYYFMIPDDFMPVEGFVKKAISTWNKIKDPRKICLTTYVEKSRIDKPCWTGQKPKEYKNYRLTQWTDMCFMCQKKFFDEVGGIQIPAVNWKRKPHMGSGVGALVSRILFKNKWNLYQTKKSLFTVQKEGFKSQMNSWRDKDDLINKPVLSIILKRIT